MTYSKGYLGFLSMLGGFLSIITCCIPLSMPLWHRISGRLIERSRLPAGQGTLGPRPLSQVPIQSGDWNPEQDQRKGFMVESIQGYYRKYALMMTFLHPNSGSWRTQVTPTSRRASWNGTELPRFNEGSKIQREPQILERCRSLGDLRIYSAEHYAWVVQTAPSF